MRVLIIGTSKKEKGTPTWGFFSLGWDPHASTPAAHGPSYPEEGLAACNIPFCKDSKGMIFRDIVAPTLNSVRSQDYKRFRGFGVLRVMSCFIFACSWVRTVMRATRTQGDELIAYAV